MRLHGTRRVVLKLRVPKTDKPVVTRAAENSCTNRNHRVCLPLRVLAKFLPISRVIWSGIGTGKSTNRKHETFPRQELSVPPLRLFFILSPLPPRKTAKLFEANGMVGRGGGDRKLSYSNKPHCFMALQPPFRDNWYKRYKLAAGDGNRTQKSNTKSR